MLKKTDLLNCEICNGKIFLNRRNYEREFRTVSANIDMILGKSYEQEQQIEKEQNL